MVVSLFRLVFAFLAIAIFATAEEVRIGKLENGLTYYIQHNEFPKDKASLQLIVKVGSIYETEEERGLAHFLEHMLFRGSENFSDWEIINYLESIGAQFGADTNAYTTFEHTTYLLQVPLEKKENLDQAILILSDFAGRATLSKELIEQERTVILDECNRGETQSNYRMQRKIYDEFFTNSSYANRMPIGLKDVILHCDPSIIQNFYKKWYCPNRMAIIAVGDFDVNLVEQQIKECFKDFKAGDETILSVDVDFPKEKKSLFMCEEEEIFVQGSFVKFFQNRNSSEDGEVFIRSSLISSFATSILNQRFDALTKQPGSPFLWAGMYQMPFTTFHGALKIHFLGFMDRPLDAVKAVYNEVELLKHFGPQEEELAREISKQEEALKIGIENLHRVESGFFTNLYHSHFLCGTPLGSLEIGGLIQKEVLSSIKCEDIKDWMEKNIELETMSRIFSMPNIGVISNDQVDSLLQEIKNEKIEAPLVESRQDLQVEMTGVASVCESISNEALGSTTLILDNGMKVVLHPTSLEKGTISIDLVAKGGKTLFNKEEYPSLEVATYYMIESGLANLNGIELKNFLQKKDCALTVGIFSNMRLIKTNGPVTESETLLKAIRALFLEKRFDLQIWDNLVEQIKEVNKYKGNMPSYFFMEESNRILYGGHPFYVPEKTSDANEEVAKKCAKIAFKNPSEFSVVIVGDFDLTNMKELVCSYFYFPESDKNDQRSIQLPILPDLKESVNEIIYKGKETHGITLMAYRKICNEKMMSELSLRALSHILTERAFKKMRRELGDTYSVYFSYEFPLDPFRGSVNVYVNFSSLPEKANELKEEAIMLISEFLKNGPSDEEVNTSKKIIEQKVKESLMFDEFWQKLHKDEILYKIAAEDLLRDKKELGMITKENLQTLAKEIFENTPVIKMSLFPEVGQVLK